MSKGFAPVAASLAVSILIVLGAVSIALPAAASASSPGSVPRIRAANGTSTNWSGYAVTAPKGSVADVMGSWVVPAVTCSSGSTAYSSFWVGIDGYSSSTVEQVGTDSDCQGGTPTYYAWYEFYPKPSFQVTSLAVRPGDTVTAEVRYSGGSFTVTMTVNSQSFSKTQRVNSAQRSSAEWIAEAPSSGGSILPLADFGTVFFGPDSATVNGFTGPVGSFGTSVQSITMVSSSGTLEAQPSTLSSDGSFSVTWYSSGSGTTTSSSASSSSSTSSSASSSTSAGSSLSVSVTTDSPSYTLNSWVYINVHVAGAGTAVAGATVVLTVTGPTGGVSSGTGTTSSTGDVQFRYRVGPHAPTGPYSIVASASASGYASESDTVSFLVL